MDLSIDVIQETDSNLKRVDCVKWVVNNIMDNLPLTYSTMT
jgi:hypothetical protein